MTVALILNGQVHQLLENQTEIPKWPPYANGESPLLVQVPDDARCGDLYNPETGAISPHTPADDGE